MKNLEERDASLLISCAFLSITMLCKCTSHMGKECVPVAIDVPRLNRRSKCGYFSPCKQGRGFARNGVQTLECINKDILNRMQRHLRTQSTEGERARLCLESSLLSDRPERGSSPTCV